MKAIYFNGTGEAPHVLASGEFDKPIPQAGQVVVRMLGSVINPADFLFIGGTYRFKPEFPQIAGLEGAGIVECTGANAGDIATGTLVAFLGKNVWAEYVAVDEKDLLPLPADFMPDKAVQFALNPVTAWGLLEKAGLMPGDWLVLTAGNSVVAQLVAKLAVIRGIRVIATVRSVKYKVMLNRIGAEVINVTDGTVAEEINRLTEGRGVAAVLDAVGGETGTDLLTCLQDQGKYIIYGRLETAPMQVDNATMLYKNLVISSFGIRAYYNSKTRQEMTALVRSLAEIVGRPEFKMPVQAAYPLDEYQEAIRMALDKASEGKVVFKMQE